METVKIVCRECLGTGLYKGMAEQDNCAVICGKCKGSGAVNYTYELFTGRKERRGITRVFKSSCGYGHSAEDVTTTDGRLIQFSKGGCSYEEWLQGAEPKPVKDLYCPYLWDTRGMGNEPLDRCKEHKGFGYISNCLHYEDKATCWKMLEDKENKNEKE